MQDGGNDAKLGVSEKIQRGFMLNHYRGVFRKLGLLFSLILVACTEPTATSISVSITILTTPSARVASPTISPTALPLPASLTVAPTTLPAFTRTIMPSPVFTATAYYHLLPTYTPTLDPYGTEVASYAPGCEPGNIDRYRSSFSPGGNWVAITCGYTPPTQSLEVDNKDGKRWIFQLKDFVPGDYVENGEVRSRGSLIPQFWTYDEKYLFFSSNLEFDGGGPCFIGGNYAAGLFRLNLEDGTISQTLPPIKYPWDYRFAFSPTGRRLAYIHDQLTILDFQTGEELKINGGSYEIGDPTWSPDGLDLAYAGCSDVLPEETTVDKAFINIYDIKTRSTKTILLVENKILRIWPLNDNQFFIYHYNYEEPDALIYDWPSGQLFIVTPTPAP